MDRSASEYQITEGTDVVGSDGEKVGEVVAVHPDYVVVEKGFFFPTDYYIPTSAVASQDGGRLYLSVTKDEALNQGWDQAPAAGGATETYATETTTASTTRYAGDTTAATTAGTAGYAADAVQPLDNDTTGRTVGGGADVSTAEAQYAADTAATQAVVDRDETTGTVETGRRSARQREDRSAQVGAEDTLRVPVHEEELTARTREVERGAVHVEKDVVAEQRQVEVPVTEERVRVERRAVDRDAAGDPTAFQEGAIEVPVRGEEVELTKRARVVEEVEIGKEAVQRTERAAGTVRREEVRVEDATVDTDPTATDPTA